MVRYIIWGIFLCLICSHNNLFALTFKWKKAQDSDRIVLNFVNPLNFSVKRSADDKISILIPDKQWVKESKPTQKKINLNLNLINSVQLNPSGIDIITKTAAFGFVFYKDKKGSLVIDVFKDKLGIYWNKEKKQAKGIKNNSKGLKVKQQRQKNQHSGVRKGNIVQKKVESKKKIYSSKSDLKVDKNIEKKPRPRKEEKKIPAKGVDYKGAWLRAPVKKTTYEKPFLLFLPEVKKKPVQKIDKGKKKKSPKGTNRKKEKGKKKQEVELSPELQLKQAMVAVINGDYLAAKEIYETLRRRSNLSPDIMIKVLYGLGDLYIRLYKDKLKEKYSDVVGMLNEAFYYNPKYFRVPELIVKLMWVNMEVGNFEEAVGYFSYLQHHYPKTTQMALALYYMGSFYLKRGEYDKGAKYLYQVVEKYPTSKFVREASVKLAICYNRLGLKKKAWKIVEYVQKRWPRYYLKDPNFLKVAADIAFKNKLYLKSKHYLWQYFNVYPKAKDLDLILTKIGDLYLLLNQKKMAKRIYNRVITLYPGKEGELIAKMRLAEEGIYDKFSIKQMFSVFDRPFNLRPVEVYKDIVKNHIKSPLAPLAQVKLISWYLWRGNYSKALKEVNNFYRLFPKSDLIVEAEDLGKRALAKGIIKLVKSGIYKRAIDFWQKYQFLHDNIDKVNPEAPLYIALSMWKLGKIKEAIDLARLSLKDAAPEKVMEEGLNLLLNIYVSGGQWGKIINLYNKYANKKGIKPYLKDQFDYAYALALESKNNPTSFQIWRKLENSDNLTELQKGYVCYFLAKHYMQKENFEEVYLYAQQALSVFIELAKDKNLDKIQSCFDMLINVTRASGRILEAIEWAERSKKFVPKDDSLAWTFYKYRLASLYKEAGYMDKWKNILKDLKEKYPNSYYGKLAAMDLEGLRIQSKISSILK